MTINTVMWTSPFLVFMSELPHEEEFVRTSTLRSAHSVYIVYIAYIQYRLIAGDCQVFIQKSLKKQKLEESVQSGLGYGFPSNLPARDVPCPSSPSQISFHDTIETLNKTI